MNTKEFKKYASYLIKNNKTIQDDFIKIDKYYESPIYKFKDSKIEILLLFLIPLFAFISFAIFTNSKKN